MDLRDVVGSLSPMYGDLPSPPSDAFAMILLENVAYLVDDETRKETFARLKRMTGVAPRRILVRSAAAIADVIVDGGMKPLMRAEKVLEAARVAEEIGLDSLKAAIADDPKRAKRMLRMFPSIGEPYADRILLFAGSVPNLAPDSNALRVLTRLGFVSEEKSYATMYRAAANIAVSDLATARRAHLLLRRHGQEVCKRSAPRCEVCPLRCFCAWYAAAQT